jgi:hypothetical protein
MHDGCGAPTATSVVERFIVQNIEPHNVLTVTLANGRLCSAQWQPSSPCPAEARLVNIHWIALRAGGQPHLSKNLCRGFSGAFPVKKGHYAVLSQRDFLNHGSLPCRPPSTVF